MLIRTGNTDNAPNIQMTIPFLFRLLELVREDVKTDVDLHIILETLLKTAKNDVPLSMCDYSAIAAANPK